MSRSSELATHRHSLQKHAPELQVRSRPCFVVNHRRLTLSRRSEVDDVNLGLQHFYGEFNVTHARLVSSGVSTNFLHGMPIASVPSVRYALISDPRLTS